MSFGVNYSKSDVKVRFGEKRPKRRVFEEMNSELSNEGTYTIVA